VKKKCVSCGKQIPSVALNCVFCSGRQPAPDFSDVDVLQDAVDRARSKSETHATISPSGSASGGLFDDEPGSQTEHTLVGLNIAHLDLEGAFANRPETNGSQQLKNTQAMPAVQLPVEPVEVKKPEPKKPEPKVEAKPVVVEKPRREVVPRDDADHPWDMLGRAVMGVGGAFMMLLFLLPWHGASSWQLLETLAGADFVRQLFYLAGGLVLLAAALLPLPFVFRAAVGASIAALPVLLGARGVLEGWRGVVAAVAIVGLPATHLLRSRDQQSRAGRSLVLAAVGAVALLYIAPSASVVPIAGVFKLIFSGSIGFFVIGVLVLVPLVFAGLSFLGAMGRDLADMEVLLSVLILLWGPVMVALRGMLMDDGTQLYVAICLLWASATSAVSWAQLLSLAARDAQSDQA
jgi:hypothetical protein